MCSFNTAESSAALNAAYMVNSNLLFGDRKMEMKMKKTKILGSAMVLTGLLVFSLLAMAGDLEPSAPPAPTMKTLDEVEPRIPISAPYTISQRGSYYLTNDIFGKISITTNDVTLDLMGYAIITSSGDSIELPSPGAYRNILIRNGTIKPGNSGIGIDARYMNESNSRFENLRIDGRGRSWAGIYVGSGCVIENCRIDSNNNYGVNFGNAGGGEIRNCVISNNLQVGLHGVSNVRVICNTIEGNGTDGLKLTGSGSYVADNIVKGNTNNYNLTANNQLNILLCEIPETIAWPATVTLAGSLRGVSGQNGITVTADDVTIDLQGHTLEGVSGTGNGIYMNDRSNVEIRNGTIRDFISGIRENDDGFGHRVINVRAVSNASHGICLFGHGHLVKGCTVKDNGYSAAGAINGWVYGICVFYGGTITDNTVFNNGDSVSADVFGIHAGAGSKVANNTVHKNGDRAAGKVHGIEVGSGTTVTGNSVYNNGYHATEGVYGILLIGNNVVDQNTAVSNGVGAGSAINMNTGLTDCAYGTNVAP